MRRLFSLVVLAAFAGPAAACINDSELPNHEREFRSQYHGSPAPAAPSSPTNYNALLYGVGGTMLVGATVVTFAGRRNRS